MATNVADTSHESDAEKVPPNSDVDRKGCVDPESINTVTGQSVSQLSSQEYKNKHHIGVRLSSDLSLGPSDSNVSPGGSLLSPIKNSFSSPSCSDESSIENDVTPLSSPTGDKDSAFTIKTLDDSGIDVDITVLHNKQPIVHLGERIAISQDGKVYNVPVSKGKSKMKMQTEKARKMKKNFESNYVPCRRIKREASLNAAARVNILYEKDVPAPKVARKTSTSSAGSTGADKTKKVVTKKVYTKKKEKSCGSDGNKHEDKSEKTTEKKDKKTKKLKPNSVVKDKVKKVTKKILSKKDKGYSKAKKGSSNAKLKVSTKAAVSKYKYYPAKLLANSAKGGKKMTKVKTKYSAKSETNRKRKSAEKEQSKSRTKKVKIDTLRAARTHFTVEKKVNFKPTSERKMNFNPTNVQCVGCYRQALCTPAGTICWSNTDYSENSKEGECLSDEKTCPSSTTTYVAPHPPRVQIMDTSGTYMNTVVPHQTIPACPQCAQRGGLIPTPPCQSYTLGGIGSISSVQVMSYPQPFGGTYPAVTYQTNHSTLPHCGIPGCASCFSATPGIYYPQTATPMSHAQPLTHDPCHVTAQPITHDPCHITSQPSLTTPPSMSIHSMSDKEESRSETEIIDVGENEVIDIKPILLTSPGSKSEKARKKSSSSTGSNKAQKNTSSSKDKKFFEKKALTFKKTETKEILDRQKSKDGKKLKEAKDKSPKKPKYHKSVSRHGWEFDGEPEKKKIASLSLGTSFEANCYQGIRHVDGDVISVRECVMLRSGPKKTDIPYVAKVTNFWEAPQDGEMMMSLLWYYQPEHTEAGRKPHHAPCELFASKHRDENSVACIDDKGYVLTFAEYCRYRAELRRQECHIPPPPSVVPSPEEEYPRSNKLPDPGVDPNQVYLCRQVYDFKLKRILKNPS